MDQSIAPLPQDGVGLPHTDLHPSAVGGSTCSHDQPWGARAAFPLRGAGETHGVGDRTGYRFAGPHWLCFFSTGEVVENPSVVG